MYGLLQLSDMRAGRGANTGELAQHQRLALAPQRFRLQRPGATIAETHELRTTLEDPSW